MRTSNAAKLPALPNVSTGNAALDKWVQAVTERLEVREGMRGNPNERAVTVRDMRDAGVSAFTTTSTTPGSVLTVNADGTYSTMTPDAFAESIRSSKLYKDLMKRLDDVTRFDGLPDQVKAVLLTDLAEEAAKRGADIRRLENKLQSTAESLAYTVEEVTAAVEGSVAGVRETVFASASANTATAGKVTQIEARLDDVGGVTIEESMTATADRVDGLAGEYMVKINAGGAVAGFGLAASEDPTGATESSFIVQADKFAVTMPGLSELVPFGVDASGVYINGSLRINAGGGLLQDAASGAPGQGVVKGVSFLRAASAPATPIGGTFASPNATGWSDGIPADDNTPLWMTTRMFTSDGLTPQQAAWTTPAKVGTPSTGIRSVFSVLGSTASIGSTDATWHVTPAVADIYMATQTSTDNGATWGAITGKVKIKGEKGDTGAASTTPGPTGSRGTAFITSTAASATDAAFTAAGGPNPPIAGDQLLLSNSSGSTIYTRGASSWVNTTALQVHGNAVISGTLAASKIVAGTLTGFTMQTAASGARYIITGTSFQGYNASNALTSSMDMATGVVQFFSSNTFNCVVGTNTAAGNGVKGINQSTGDGVAGEAVSGAGVSGKSQTGDGVFGTSTGSSNGVRGSSISGFGGVFQGNATRAPINIAHTTKPTNATTGGMMIYNIPGVGDRLCYCLGGAWYYLATNTGF